MSFLRPRVPLILYPVKEVWFKVNGIYVKGMLWVKVDGIYQQKTPLVKINGVYRQLFEILLYNQLFTVSPLVAGSLQVALSQVASLGQSESFALIWSLISSNIPPGYREQWVMYAQENHLPADFIEILLS